MSSCPSRTLQAEGCQGDISTLLKRDIIILLPHSRPDRVPGVAAELPKNLQGWYAQPTEITVPGANGKQYTFTTCSACYVRFNPMAFQGRTVQTPNGSYVPDLFWWGNADMAYDDIRNPNIFVMDASLEREFRITERWRLSFAANAYNVLNHANFKPGNTAYNLGGYADIASGRPILNPNVGNWGPWTYDPRQIQLQLRLTF
jgi:hypothetical protein